MRTHKSVEELLPPEAIYPCRTFIRLGRENGYPECCIAAFCMDFIRGLAPGQERIKQGWEPDDSGYVPCPEHIGVPR